MSERASRVAEFAGTRRYRVVRRLGSGGMGEVYEVWDRLWEAPVALKRLSRTGTRQLARFKREFRSLANVSHPNLAALYELVVGADHSFFTMELVDGMDLLAWIRGPDDVSYDPSGDTLRLSPSETTIAGGGEHPELGVLFDERDEAPFHVIRPVGSFDEKRLRAIGLQVCDAISALHGLGKLHRDLKPSNVLVTAEGRAVVLDFGLVEDLGDNEEVAAEVAGTPGYMAPEQESGDRTSPATDWYGFGAILFEALVGIRPRSSRQLGKLVGVLDPTSLPVDLWRLCCDLLRREPAERPRGEQVRLRLRGAHHGSPALASRRRGPALTPLLLPGRFVGREQEIAELEAAVQESRRLCTRLAIHGRSGIGKSALIERFLERLQDDDRTVVLRGRCFEQESVPYKAFDALVEDLEAFLGALPTARLDALMPAEVDALARVFPVIGKRRGMLVSGEPRREPEEPQLVRHRAFDALRELLRRIAERQPVVLWIDDLQWADADSRALLESLWREPQAPRVLWLLSFRSEEVESRDFLAELVAGRGRPGRRVIELGPLPSGAARRLAAGWLGEERSGFVDAVVEEAAGNTFLLQELARHARSVERDAAAPIDLEAVVEARLAVQPPGARKLLQVLAVAGRPLGVEAAFGAVGEMREGRSLLVSLRAAQLLRTEGTLDRVEIFHDRLREVLLARLGDEERREIHARLAAALERAGEGEPDALYEHHLAAGHRQDAARYAELAAQRAIEALAFGRAAAFLERALALAAPQDERRHELALRRAEALAWAGRVEESAAAYLALDSESTGDDDDPRRLEHRRAAAQQYLLGGYLDQGLETMDEVLRFAGIGSAPSGRRALPRLAWLRLRVRLRGVRFTERAAAQIPERELLRIDACWAAAAGLGLVDTFRGAIFQARGLLLSLAAGEPYRIARSFAVEASFAASAGRHGLGRAERFLDLARQLAHRTENPHAIALTHISGGLVAFLTGDWSRAVERCERALELLDQCRGVLWERTTTGTFLLGSLQYLGRLEELAAEVPAMSATAETVGNLNAVTELATRFNMVWLIGDDPEGARQVVEQSIGRWSQSGFHRQHCNALRAEVHIDLYRGEGRAAWRRVEQAWPELRRSLLLGVQVLRVDMLYARACSALALLAEEGPDPAVRRDAESAARRLKDEGVAWIRPFGWLVEAGLAALDGDSSTAQSKLSAASAGFEATGTHLWEAATRHRLAKLEDADDGGERASHAAEWFFRRGVLDPDRFSWMLAPVGRPVERWRPAQSLDAD